MCGIVGAVAQREVSDILLEGLRRLEYRGYDSAGTAILDHDSKINRIRSVGKVHALEEALQAHPLSGSTGIAHTRWATHGKPSIANAHPHICNEQVAMVHNGIIENHQQLRDQQSQQGYKFTSDTDSEVIVHQISMYLDQGNSLLRAVQKTVADLHGAYALAVISVTDPEHLIVARRGSPLVIGVGIGENFVASDVAALLPVTREFLVLEDGDVANVGKKSIDIYDFSGKVVKRNHLVSNINVEAAERGEFRHYMLKEIFEQPRAISDTLEGRIANGKVLEGAFGPDALDVLNNVERVQIIACGTSYHAGLIGRYWLESIAQLPCDVEVASEFRYRKPVVRKNALIVTLSQSGETADTIAALHEAKRLGFGHSLAICNVPESTLVRESELVLMTRAGPEIGVASTKAFTTQLVALLLLVIVLARRTPGFEQRESHFVSQLMSLPRKIEKALSLKSSIKEMAENFSDKRHALFLGRGDQYPVAMEGALKLKEISYIHAEAYPAGELKHGPLALIDEDMPVVAVAPNNELLEKLKSNLREVEARGGRLFVFADQAASLDTAEQVYIIPVAPVDDVIAPIVYTIPLQLLSYYVAVLKGTDVDQPRNLAKSVTVE